MNERQWELYRLSMVKEWAESPYKKAASAAIEYKLMVLAQQREAREVSKRQLRTVEVRPEVSCA